MLNCFIKKQKHVSHASMISTCFISVDSFSRSQAVSENMCFMLDIKEENWSMQSCIKYVQSLYKKVW